MTADVSRVKIYIRPGYTDLRKEVNGLTVIIRKDNGIKSLKRQCFSVLQPEQESIKGGMVGQDGILVKNLSGNKAGVNRDQVAPNYYGTG
jgi:hypothetical protein